VVFHIAELGFAVRAGDSAAQINRQGDLLVHVDLDGRWTQRCGVAGFSAGGFASFAFGHGGLDESRRPRFGSGLKLLAKLGNLSPQRGILLEGALMLVLERSQLTALILALRELLPQGLILLPQALILNPEKVVALEQSSAIHGAIRLNVLAASRYQQKTTGR
jgi:hypothetical protein